MNFRPFALLFLGLFVVSCSPDPRWGPPRSGLREPMEWQYKDANKPTSISYGTPETPREEAPIEFVAHRPGE